jgi:multidrug efflux system membrane fusion protein
VDKLKSGTEPAGSGLHQARRLPAKLLPAVGCAVAVAIAGWLVQSRGAGAAAADAPAAGPQVTVSTPLKRELDVRLGFLGQLVAVDSVELRPQVGGTLTGIHFKDGDTVREGDLLFTIDSRPYEIRLVQAKAQLETAKARLVLADRELHRAQELERNNAGTTQSAEQRTSEQLAARASVDDTGAQVRDAQFDLDHCRVVAPLTGRIGSHLVSVGNLIAGSRAGTSPTTLLATIVSLDPIHLRFEMSEADYQAFSQRNNGTKAFLANKVELALGDSKEFTRQGTLDFINNVLDHSSGTILVRATVPNRDLALTPGEFARVRLMAGRPTQTLLVPDAAVLQDQSQHVVLTVAADGTVVPKQVRIGELRGGLRVIRSGLLDSERVVVDGLPYAAPGSKVTTKSGAIQFAAAQD